MRKLAIGGTRGTWTGESLRCQNQLIDARLFPLHQASRLHPARPFISPPSSPQADFTTSWCVCGQDVMVPPAPPKAARNPYPCHSLTAALEWTVFTSYKAVC